MAEIAGKLDSIETPTPVWQRHKVVVEVDVIAVDEWNNRSFVESEEVARHEIEGILLRDKHPGFGEDQDGVYFGTWHGQVRVRIPIKVEDDDSDQRAIKLATAICERQRMLCGDTNDARRKSAYVLEELCFEDNAREAGMKAAFEDWDEER